MKIEIGSTLEGRYRIDAFLARGGMGAVYKAWDTRLSHAVAIKENFAFSPTVDPLEETVRLDFPTPPTSPGGVDQFAREAQLLARLRHPGLPKVTDHFVIPNQGQYLVMEYVDGQDLQSLLKQAGKLDPARAASITGAICEVLEYLHRQDPPVYHRDIKPANIRLTSRGDPVLVDFGVAKEGSDLETRVGARGVTAGYSPLEQYGGAQRTDARSDVYSLGATLFALVSGHAPPAATDRALPSPPAAFELSLGGLDPGMRAVIMRAMAVRPEERFATAAAMRASLAQLAELQKEAKDQSTKAWESPTQGASTSAPTGGATETGGGRAARDAAASIPERRTETDPARRSDPRGRDAGRDAPAAADETQRDATRREREGRAGKTPPARPPDTSPPERQGGARERRSGLFALPRIVSVAVLVVLAAVVWRLLSAPQIVIVLPRVDRDDIRVVEVHASRDPAFTPSPTTRLATAAPMGIPEKVPLRGLPAGTTQHVKVIWVTGGGDQILASEASIDVPTSWLMKLGGTAPVSLPPAAPGGLASATPPAPSPAVEAKGADTSLASGPSEAEIAQAAADSAAAATRAKITADSLAAAAAAAKLAEQRAASKETGAGGAPSKDVAAAPVVPPPVPAPTPGATGGSADAKKPPPEPVAPTPATSTPPIAASPGVLTIVVSLGGPVPSIQAAVLSAKKSPQDLVRIEIQPGTYPLASAIWIDSAFHVKRWELVGAGGEGAVILEAPASVAIILDARTEPDQEFVLRGVTIRCAAPERAAVIVAHGGLVLEDCVVKSSSRACLQMEDQPLARARLRGCRLEGPPGQPAILAMGGQLDLESTEVSGGKSCLEVRQSAVVRLSGCRVHGAVGSGVYVHDGGAATLAQTAVFENTLSGISVRAGKLTVVDGSSIRANRAFGIRCEGTGVEIVVSDDCTFSENSPGDTSPDCVRRAP